MTDFLQFIFSGVTNGAVYGLVGLGFTMIYNSSHVVNFAQGEFVMVGGLATVFLTAAGIPLPLAAMLAIALTIFVGLALEWSVHRSGAETPVITLIIITIGASITIRGLAQVLWGRKFHSLPPFSGNGSFVIAGASITYHALWVLGLAATTVIALQWFLGSSRYGKAIRATSHNPLAAQLVGIETRMTSVVSYALSATLGAVAGVIITPISLMHVNAGIYLGLKGFAACILGGLGAAYGAVVGGLLVGISEALTAGYLSSAYKDTVAFLIILLVLLIRPSGLFGSQATDRV